MKVLVGGLILCLIQQLVNYQKQKNNSMKRVVITGMGAITPIGKTVDSFWDNLTKGVSGSTPISRFDTDNFKTKFACEVKDFDPLEYLGKKEARRLDRYAQYGLIAAEEAIIDANIDIGQLDSTRLGVIFSSGIGGLETFEKEVINYTENNRYPRFNPFFIPKMITNSLAGLISIKYGFKGVSYCPVTACASSTQSVIHAFNYIKSGKGDLFIAGGAEAPITEASIGGFNSIKSMSRNNQNYSEASKPFDIDRDGFVMGEGAGALIIESLESAKKRGAKIYAEIIGGGESSDAYHITGSHPEGEGAYHAMSLAIQEAGIDRSKIDYINAHATSTSVGDESEAKAIGRIFNTSQSRAHISATKSMTGHLLGATGAVEAIITSMAVANDMIPPTINVKNIDQKIIKSLNGIPIVLDKALPKTINIALSNSFGFGGHCAALLLKKFLS